MLKGFTEKFQNNFCSSKIKKTSIFYKISGLANCTRRLAELLYFVEFLSSFFLIFLQEVWSVLSENNWINE